MVAMKAFLREFGRDECGATVIEYSLIAAVVAAAIVPVLQTLGGFLITAFTNPAEAIASVIPGN